MIKFFLFLYLPLNIKGWGFYWLEHGNMHRPAEKGEVFERHSCL